MNDDPQKLARQFNEDEAVWLCYEKKRKLSRIFRHLLSRKERKKLEERLWLAAEGEARPVRAIGKWIDT